MGSSGNAHRRFVRAVDIGNPLLVRAAAAELPRIGIAEAAAILLVVRDSEPGNYDRAALRWLAKLAAEAPGIDLPRMAEAATARDRLRHSDDGVEILARVCRQAGQPEVATAFARSRRALQCGGRRSVEPTGGHTGL